MTLKELNSRIFSTDRIKFLASPSEENYINCTKCKWTTVGKYEVTYDMHYDDEEKTILIINFRQTSSDIDWHNNILCIAQLVLDTPCKPYKKSKIWFAHKGLSRAYKSVNDIFINEIKNNPNITHIIIRGFSQGAAYTILCTEDVNWLLESTKRLDKIKVYSIAYEPPRIIFIPFSWNVYKRIKDIIIIKNSGDIVTHVPLLIMLFKHFGNVFMLGEKWRDIFPLHIYHNIDVCKKNLKDTFGH